MEGEKLRRILSQFAKANYLVAFRDVAMISQLYFDGLLEREDRKKEEWGNQKKVLDDILESGKDIAEGFLAHDSVLLEKAKARVAEDEPYIRRYSSKEPSKVRHIQPAELKELNRFCHQLTKHVPSQIDTIACIASGGFEPSYAVGGLVYKDAEIVPFRYSRWYKEDKTLKVPKNAEKDYLDSRIRGKTVLLLEDVIITGETLLKCARAISKLGPKELYCASVYSERSPAKEFSTWLIRNEDEMEKLSNSPFVFKYYKQKQKQRRLI